MREETFMSARIAQPALAVPGAMGALQSLGAAIDGTGVPARTISLINVRASQINRCAVCLEGGLREARRLDETENRMALLAAWRETPEFEPAERAALALTEAVTRLADDDDPVPGAVWEAAARCYDETQLAGLVLQIASINLWNRLNVATRQQAGVHAW
jgi:AhpD family alkylhydroperoxidase